MSSKKNILTQITRNKNFSINIRKPFDEYVIDFISDFSNEIRRSSKKIITI